MLTYVLYLLLVLSGNDDLVEYTKYENIDYNNDIVIKILDEDKQHSKELECIKAFIPENSAKVEIYKYIVGVNAIEKAGNTFGPDDTKKMSKAYSIHSDVHRVYGKIFAVSSKYHLICKISIPASPQILSGEVKEYSCKVCDDKHKLYIMNTSDNIFITTDNIGIDKIEEITNQNIYDKDNSASNSESKYVNIKMRGVENRYIQGRLLSKVTDQYYREVIEKRYSNYDALKSLEVTRGANSVLIIREDSEGGFKKESSKPSYNGNKEYYEMKKRAYQPGKSSETKIVYIFPIKEISKIYPAVVNGK